MPEVLLTKLIKADKAKVYSVTKEMERFPDFMPDVKKVKILERMDNKTITDWESLLEDTPICWKEQDEFDDATPKIKFKLIEGDLDKLDGEWKFEDAPEGTKVTLSLDYDFGMPAFERIVGPVLKLKIIENFEKMMEGIRAKIEGK